MFTKSPSNPLLPPTATDTFFDCCVVPLGADLRLYLSWRDRQGLAACESPDGVSWSAPALVFAPEPTHPWEAHEVNRPSVVQTASGWWLWYTGQNRDLQTSALGLARSEDGLHWERASTSPVLEAVGGWEKQSLMCPHVIWEGDRFRMWYSGGDQFEPDAIGYAESADGVHWRRAPENPVLIPAGGWEAARVAGACIVAREHDYLAFYIGFAEGYEHSSIGMARSRDGIHDWERYPGNPIISPGPQGDWDDCNVYKPYVLRRPEGWYLWYNASRASDRREQLGLALAETLDF